MKLAPANRAFTLVEIMIVVAIMCLLMGVGIPAFVYALRREGFRKTVNDFEEVCTKTRADAILNGQTTEMVFHPAGRSIEGGGLSAKIDDETEVQMLDVNLTEYKDAEAAYVRFFPNGTCDEMTLILHTRNNQYRKFTLEITTGLLNVTDKLE